MSVLLYVGKQCDPWFINELFKVQDFAHIDRHMAEEEIFSPGYYEGSSYLVALYNIINNSMRAQRKPFCELRILTEGDPESDNLLRALLVNDQIANPVYNLDFTKFLATITGSGGVGAIGPGTGAIGGPGSGAAAASTTAGYY
jgi:hypothetical protein